VEVVEWGRHGETSSGKEQVYTVRTTFCQHNFRPHAVYISPTEEKRSHQGGAGMRGRILNGFLEPKTAVVESADSPTNGIDNATPNRGEVHYEPERREHIRSLAEIAARIISKSEQNAERIIDEARAKAEAEAATIIAQSEQRAQQVFQEAEKKAEAQAAERLARLEQEAREAVEKMKSQAEIEVAQIIAQSEQKAESVVDKAKAKAEAEAVIIITQSQRRSEEILEDARKMVEPEAAKVIAESEQKAQSVVDEAKAKAEADAATTITQSQRRAEEILEDARKRAEPEAAKVIAESEQKASAILQEAEKHTIDIKNEAKRQAEVEAAQIKAHWERRAQEILEVVKRRAEVEACEIITESVLRIREIVEGVEEIPRAAGAEESDETPPVATVEGAEWQQETGAGLYQGAVELIIAPPIDSNKMRGFEASLRSCPEVQVLTVGGSVGSDAQISIQVEKPVRLVEIIKHMPVVKGVLEQEQEQGSLPTSAERLNVLQHEQPKSMKPQRILVILRER